MEDIESLLSKVRRLIDEDRILKEEQIQLMKKYFHS